MEAAIAFMVVIAPLCNSPSGMYVLMGFSVKMCVGRQIFHQVAPFCQVTVLRFSDIHKINDICWVCKSRTVEAANWPVKMENLTRCWEVCIFTGWREKIHWVCYRGLCCFILLVR